MYSSLTKRFNSGKWKKLVPKKRGKKWNFYFGGGGEVNEACSPFWVKIKNLELWEASLIDPEVAHSSFDLKAGASSRITGFFSYKA